MKNKKLSQKLEEIRRKIDSIDFQIRELIAQRIQLLYDIKKIKTKLRMEVYDEKRELEIIDKAIEHAKQLGIDPEFAQSLTRVLINYARRKEHLLHRQYKPRVKTKRKKLLVAILGPRGTFTEEAARYYFTDTIELKSFLTIPEIFNAVEEEKVEHGVVAVENSLEGSIGITLDSLLETNAKIYGEIVLPIIHCLAAKPNAKFENIKTIISHPQALAQTHQFLKGRFPRAELKQSPSTAEAAKSVAEGFTKDIAAICSKTAARLYGLKTLAESIQDGENFTRFIVLSKTGQKRVKNSKTSVVFGLKSNRPGELYRALGEFAARNINLTKIESRPSKRALGDYFFFVDMEGYVREPIIEEALRSLEKKVAFLKVLGSYPKAEY
ncbi:MAG: prephenate dehydratase [Euryarchaeota archaeon]|nr:prephenate dehydratase [Euryarchaeota archaeon]